MNVFISHKSEDQKNARHAYDFLTKKGISAYLSSLDDIINSQSDISSYLRKQIDSCSDLLVVMSEGTKKSWWVPFEVGLATESDKRIATAVYSDKELLPSFLENGQ